MVATQEHTAHLMEANQLLNRHLGTPEFKSYCAEIGAEIQSPVQYKDFVNEPGSGYSKDPTEDHEASAANRDVDHVTTTDITHVVLKHGALQVISGLLQDHKNDIKKLEENHDLEIKKERAGRVEDIVKKMQEDHEKEIQKLKAHYEHQLGTQRVAHLEQIIPLRQELLDKDKSLLSHQDELKKVQKQGYKLTSELKKVQEQGYKLMSERDKVRNDRDKKQQQLQRLRKDEELVSKIKSAEQEVNDLLKVIKSMKL